MRNRPGFIFVDTIFHAIIIALTLYIFWTTAYNTITWWKGCSNLMAAACLGNDFPPGSLILTLFGWIFTKIKLADDIARSINMSAGIIGAITAIFLYYLIIQFARFNKEIRSLSMGKSIMLSFGAASAALTFAFAYTAWHNSVQFAPYLLSATFTAMILMAIIEWYNQTDINKSIKWIFIILLLFGLDVSVHRTNLLIAPGFLIMVALVRPRTFLNIKAWISGAVALALGISFHLITILLARGNPALNANDPSNWERFYQYISLQQYGGSWLVNLWPRKGPFWSYQLVDYLNSFKQNLIVTDGAFAMFGVTVPILALVGIYFLFKNGWKLATGLVVLFLCSSLGAVIYFNVPAGFYWPMDRHYLPSFLIFSIFVGYGLVMMIYLLIKNLDRFKPIVLAVFILIAIGMPSMQIATNYDKLDCSKKYFAYDYGMNILNTMEPNGILFIMGDVYWPPAYITLIEKKRPDITVISTSLTNTQWYIRQIIENDHNLPLDWSDAKIDSLTVPLWSDSTIVFYVDSNHTDFHLTPNDTLSDSIAITVPPTVTENNLLIQDQLLIDLIKTNRWRRPIYFTEPPSYLMQYIRFDGMLAQLLPIENPSMNLDILADNLMNRYSFRGYNNYDIELNRFTKSAAEMYYRPFLFLAMEYIRAGEVQKAREVLEHLDKTIPIDRIDPSENLQMMNDQLREYLSQMDKMG